MIKLIFSLLLFVQGCLGAFDGLDLLPKETLTEAPNPVDLKPGWWGYYAAGPDTLITHKAETEKTFAQLKENYLSEDVAANFSALTEKFLSSLQVLIDLKQKTPEKRTYIANVLKSYSFQEWLDLETTLISEQQNLQEMQLELDLKKIAIRTQTRDFDTQFSHYLTDKTAEKTVKLIKGLELMNMRVSIEIAAITSGHLETEVQAQNNKVQEIQQEVATSRDRLDFNTITLVEIDANLSGAQKRLQGILEELSSAYTKPEAIEAHHVTYLNFERIKARLDVMNLEMQKLIVLLGKEEKVEELNKQVDAWRDEIKRIETEIGSWKNENLLQLEQILKQLALVQEPSSQKEELESYLKSAESNLLEFQQIQNQISYSTFLLAQISYMKKEVSLFSWGFFANLWDEIASFFKTHAQWFNQSLFKIGDIPVTPLGILKFITILIVVSFIAQLARLGVRKLGSKTQFLKSSSVYILSRFVYYFILIVGLIIALTKIGFETTTFALLFGALVVWVGFGLQQLFLNFISGVIVLITHSLRVGDIITLESGQTGIVAEINLRTTILTTAEGLEIVVPNSELVTKKFINRTLFKMSRRINIPFRISLQQDKEFVKKILVEAAKKIPITLSDPEPELWLLSYGENHVKCEFVVWVNEFLVPLANMSTEALYFGAIHEALRANNVEIPLIEVHML